MCRDSNGLRETGAATPLGSPASLHHGAHYALAAHEMWQAKSHTFATSDALDAATNRKCSPLDRSVKK